MSDSGRQFGDCSHGQDAEFCHRCLTERVVAAESCVRSIATMLGWVNIPPQLSLENDLREIMSRIKVTKRESDELLAWKSQASKLLCEYDAIAESFGGKLGSRKVANLAAGVANLRAEVERLKSEVAICQRSTWIAITNEQREELSKMEWAK